MRLPSVVIAKQLLQFANIQGLFFPSYIFLFQGHSWILAIWNVFLTVIWFICKWGFIWLFSFDKFVKTILSASWCSYLHLLKAISKLDLAIQGFSLLDHIPLDQLEDLLSVIYCRMVSFFTILTGVIRTHHGLNFS